MLGRTYWKSVFLIICVGIVSLSCSSDDRSEAKCLDADAATQHLVENSFPGYGVGKVTVISLDSEANYDLLVAIETRSDEVGDAFNAVLALRHGLAEVEVFSVNGVADDRSVWPPVPSADLEILTDDYLSSLDACLASSAAED